MLCLYPPIKPFGDRTMETKLTVKAVKLYFSSRAQKSLFSFIPKYQNLILLANIIVIVLKDDLYVFMSPKCGNHILYSKTLDTRDFSFLHYFFPCMGVCACVWVFFPHYLIFFGHPGGGGAGGRGGGRS